MPLDLQRTPVLMQFFAVGTLVLIAAPATLLADVPNPSFSTCVFPEALPMPPTAVTVDVTVQKGENRPLEGVTIQVDVLVESGALALGQATRATAYSDATGHASAIFEDGISGGGEIRLQIHADGILLCTSTIYRLAAPVSVLPSTWGHLKAFYTGA